MKHVKRLVLGVLVAFMTVACALPAHPASAAGSSALSIAPKKNYVIEPGKSVDDKLIVRNMDTKAELSLTLRVVDFTYTDDGGTPKLFLDPNAPQTTWSLKPFMSLPKNVTIPAGGTKSLDMSVKIPAGHGAGSYYSAIVYSTGTPDINGGGNVGLSASGVTLAFVNIPGKVHEDLKLTKFGPYQEATADHKADFRGFMTDMPKLMGYQLQNKGNVAESPVGSITLKDLFGNKRTIDNVNPNGSLALIGQTRTFTSCIKQTDKSLALGGSRAKSVVCDDNPGLWPGMYTATIDLFYGQNGNNTKEITKTITFWYMPWWLIITIIVIVLIIALFIWRTVVKIRRKTGKTKKPNKK